MTQERPERPLSEAEVARRLLAHRRATDPVLCHERTPTQAACYASLATYRLITGANRSGKTTEVIMDCAAYARGIHAHRPWFGPVTILVIVPARAQAAGVWGARLLSRSQIKGPLGRHPLIPPWDLAYEGARAKVTWSPSAAGKYPSSIELANGSRIYIALSGDPRSWERLQGFAFDAIYRDEAVGNANLGAELLARLLENQNREDRPHSGFMLWGATPTLINEEFEKYRDRCRSGAPGHAVFEIGPDENPAVTAAARESMRAAMSDEEASIRLDGTSTAADFTYIYARQWNHQRHVLAREYEIDPEDNILVGYDPGGVGAESNNTGMVIGVLRREAPSHIRFVHEILHNRTTLVEDMQALAEWLRGRFIHALIYDPAMRRKEKGNGLRLTTQLSDAAARCGIEMMQGLVMPHNRHRPGINLVREYLDPDPSDRSVTPWISFNPSMKMTIRQLTHYRSHRENEYTGAHGVVLKDTELPDVVRYVVAAVAGLGRGNQAMVWSRNERLNQPLWTGARTIVPERDRPQTEADRRAQRQAELSALAARRRMAGRRLMGTGW